MPATPHNLMLRSSHYYHPLRTALYHATNRRARVTSHLPPMPSLGGGNNNDECPSTPSPSHRTSIVAGTIGGDVMMTRGRALLSKFDFPIGYMPSNELSDDENYMDMVMIITRSSKLRQGSMGCILVRPSRAMTSHDDSVDGAGRRIGGEGDVDRRDALYDGIIAASTNTSLFRRGDSDVHAEINAIGQVAAAEHATSTVATTSSITTFGATAYITMPPCKNCFGALHASGIRRIVSRVGPSQASLVGVARGVGIEMSSLTREQSTDQRTRLDELYSKGRIVTTKRGRDECTHE